MTQKWEPWERERRGPKAITRRQWRLSQSPGEMIDHLEVTQDVDETRSGKRMLRLFHVACCRRGSSMLERDPVRPVLEAAERYADGAYQRDRMIRLVERVRADLWNALPDEIVVSEEYLFAELQYGHLPPQIDHLRIAVLDIGDPRQAYELESHYLTIAHGVAGRGLVAELSLQCALLRDIFGDPFHLVAFNPAWRTDTAVTLARAMYESRNFSAMPILADALEDADCHDDVILSHCRDPEQVHVRGCWVVDAVLGMTSGMSHPKTETTERSPS